MVRRSVTRCRNATTVHAFVPMRGCRADDPQRALTRCVRRIKGLGNRLDAAKGECALADLLRGATRSQHVAVFTSNLQESLMSNHVRLKALVAAVGLAVGATGLAASPSMPLTHASVIKQATQLRAGDTVIGPMALTKSMRVTLSLHWRNAAQLQAFIANPHHPNLTHAEFVVEYAPSANQVDQVEAFLRQQGFHDIQVTSDNLLVSGAGSVADVQSAFNTNLVQVHTRHGRLAFANSTAARIPDSLKGVVHEVLGLQTVHRFHVLKRPGGGGGGSSVGTEVSHSPLDFPTIYDAGTTATGSTVSVGVITSGSVSPTLSDFKTFLSENPSLGNIPLNVVTVDGGGTSATGTTEWDLDTQDIAGMSGGVKALYLYDTSSLSNQGLVDDFSAATTADVVRVVNVSIGGCETSAETNGAATGDNIFQEADAEGMTFSVSAGDSGADECGRHRAGASWPANSQYVVAVGGTELWTTGSNGTTWANETVWNDASGATGGSPSLYEPMPSWQVGVGQNAGHTTRGVPDVAMDASPYSGASIIVNGSPEVVGGTSLASPLFVGVWARALATNSSLGFAAPLIYADAKTNYATDFHDVTSGNNNGETAAAGWDYCSGFGTLNVANFVAHVATGG
ncbi:MAG: peptidase S53 [Rhodanobacteraceae bacterium]|nr:MAG: peptidase S53 [Rhodanobacteraceae bacterium]